MRRSRILRILAGVAALAVVLIGGVILMLKSSWSADYVERKAVAYLEARLDSKVEIGSLALALYPRVAVSGTGFQLTRNDSPDGQPFVSIERFRIAASPWELRRRHVERIELDGLEFRVVRGTVKKSSLGRPTGDVLVDTIVINDGRLLIVPRNPEKLPLEFALHQVTVSNFGFDRCSS